MGEKVEGLQEIEVVVSGVFHSRHRLETAAGELGTFSFPAFRGGGVFRTPEGREWSVQRTGWWRPTYELRDGEALVATAHPRGAFRREVAVEYAGRTYVLRPLGFWARVWCLLDEADVPLLEIHPRGVFRRGACLKVLEPVDLPLTVFVYYLVYARWQEEATAAAAAAA